MLLPAKHIKLAESILGLGAFVLRSLSEPKTLDALWRDFTAVRGTDAYPAHHSFDNLILAVDFLYTLGTVSIDGRGRISRCA